MTVIKKHNFEVAKSNIERFSRNLPSDPSFDRVEVNGGLFGLGDHKVTGSEMNAFIGVVQNKLISVNSSLKSIIKEFKDVYNAFDYLDAEYISGIIGSIESAEEASKQALQAQTDIRETVENLKKTVLGLLNLKATVERIEKTVKAQSLNILSHDEIAFNLDKNYKIKHIPTLTKAISTLQINYTSLFDKLSLISTEVDKVKELFSLEKDRNDALDKLYYQLSSNIHYKDIDVIWNDVECQKNSIINMHQQIDSHIRVFNQVTDSINNNIVALQQFRSILDSHAHLCDIDAIWCDVEEYKINLAAFHQQVNNFIEKVNQENESIKNNIISIQQYQNILKSYKHLNDIDIIWDNIDKQMIKLDDLRQLLNNFILEIRTSEDEIKDYIQKMKEYNTSVHLSYEKKIKIAYGIGGTAIGISIINFILQILGIL